MVVISEHPHRTAAPRPGMDQLPRPDFCFSAREKVLALAREKCGILWKYTVVSVPRRVKRAGPKEENVHRGKERSAAP